eukprot:gene17172-26353_t
MWPAYGEDVEYVVRAQAAKLPLCKAVPQPTFTHNTATNMKVNPELRAIVSRFRNGVEYLRAKWGFDIFNHPEPIVNHFMHPWNNPNISYSTWVLDPVLRRCIETGEGPKAKGLCAYNLAGLRPLIEQNNRPAAFVYSWMNRTTSP